MSDRADPLAQPPVEGPDRLFFAEGIMLDATDLTAEQNYHRGRLARALKYLFGSGTVAGLEVSVEPEAAPTEEIRVSPGLALDGLGRLIELPRPACLRVDPWFEAQEVSALAGAWRAVPPIPFDNDPASGVIVDVFLRFEVCDRGKTPAFATGPFDATDAVQPSRLRDGYRLSMVLRDEADPPRPPDQAAAGAGIPGALADWRTAVLNGWRDGSEHWSNDQPPRMIEHRPDQDLRDVLLARLLVPADGPVDADSPPTRRLAEPVRVDNLVRRFVYAPGVLAFDLEES